MAKCQMCTKEEVDKTSFRTKDNIELRSKYSHGVNGFCYEHQPSWIGYKGEKYYKAAK